MEILLRDRVKVLAARGICEMRFAGKLDYKDNHRRGKQEIWVKPDATAEPSGQGGRIPLTLSTLANATLSIQVLLDHQKKNIEKFTIQLVGTDPNGRPRLISVELDHKLLGRGACSHAAIHCHVGPDHESAPEVRVPFPAMKPWDALDWVLSVVVPNWEPLPWTPPEDAELPSPPDWSEARRAWFARQAR